MNLKKIVTSLISTSLMISSSIIPINAEQSNASGRFKMYNAPQNAQYNIYKDTNQNYIYDNEDILLGTLKCNADGVGYFNNLSEGYYVAVLQTEYPKLDTDKEYSFHSDGESITSQQAYVSNRLSWNITYASTSDTINLMYDVPLYKQADSRWGNLTINGSSSTMKSVGCLITSFAMLRSYETGTQILPSQMMKPYSSSTGVGVTFSSGASMSVPKSASNYGWNVYGYTSSYGGNGEIANNTKTNQTLLKALYEKVKCGPVIYGGYSTYGGRGSSNHWIVVNGYIGDGENFSASDFYICDPGATRTTLADYITKYPYWDRIIYNPKNVSQVTTTTTTTELIVTTTLIPNLTTLPKNTSSTSTVSNITDMSTTTQTTIDTAVTTTLIPNLTTLSTTDITTVTTIPMTSINTDTITLPKETPAVSTLDTVTTTPVTTINTDSVSSTEIINDTLTLLGDINQDGLVNQIDVYVLKKYLLSGEIITDFNTQNADTDNNNKINLNDLNVLLNTLLKK